MSTFYLYVLENYITYTDPPDVVFTYKDLVIFAINEGNFHSNCREFSEEKICGTCIYDHMSFQVNV